MKLQYVKPVVKKINYEYDEQIVAKSTPQGVQARPSHPSDCQYSKSNCNQIYVGGASCLMNPMSLRKKK